MADELDYGYGVVDEVVAETSAGNKFLKLENDRQYQLRIASPPRYVLRHWTQNRTKVELCGGDECVYCGKNVKPSERLPKDAQWGWVVIDRDDNKVKILQGPNSVARFIKDLTQIINKRTNKPTWGDPRTFDIFIKKTKKANGFTEYSVEGDPDSRTPMTAEELALIAEAGIDLEKSMKSSKRSENIGNYGGGATADLETAPAETDVDPTAIPKDLGEEKDGTNEDVNPDDIPF